jgi:uncharacterized protein
MSTQVILYIIIIGLAAGVLSGLVGVGGGIIIVPALVYFVGFTQHQAQGTTLGLLLFPVGILGFIYYYKFCQQQGTPIDFKIIGIMAVGFILGSLLGSRLAVRIDQVMLRRIFAIILFYTAFKMLNWDKAIINWVKQLF